jgi:hypothetical protein
MREIRALADLGGTKDPWRILAEQKITTKNGLRGEIYRKVHAM